MRRRSFVRRAALTALLAAGLVVGAWPAAAKVPQETAGTPGYLIIGTYLIHKNALNKENLAAAKATMNDSGQGMLYKSEWANGAWFNLGNAGGILDLLNAKGKTAVSAAQVDAMKLTVWIDENGKIHNLMTAADIAKQKEQLDKDIEQLKKDNETAVDAGKLTDSNKLQQEQNQKEATLVFLKALESGDQAGAEKVLGRMGGDPQAVLADLQAQAAALAGSLGEEQKKLEEQLKQAQAAGDKQQIEALEAKLAAAKEAVGPLGPPPDASAAVAQADALKAKQAELEQLAAKAEASGNAELAALAQQQAAANQAALTAAKEAAKTLVTADLKKQVAALATQLAGAAAVNDIATQTKLLAESIGAQAQLKALESGLADKLDAIETAIAKLEAAIQAAAGTSENGAGTGANGAGAGANGAGAGANGAGTGTDGAGTGANGAGAGANGAGAGANGAGTGANGAGTGANGAGTGANGAGTGANGAVTGTDGAGTGANGAGTGTNGAGAGANGAGTGANGAGTGANGAGTGTDGAGTGANGAGTGANGAGTGANGAGTRTDGAGTGANGAGTGANGAGTGTDGAGTGTDGAGTGANGAGTGANGAGAGANGAGTGANGAGAEVAPEAAAALAVLQKQQIGAQKDALFIQLDLVQAQTGIAPAAASAVQQQIVGQLETLEQSLYTAAEYNALEQLAAQISAGSGGQIAPLPANHLLTDTTKLKLEAPPVVIGGSAFIHIRSVSEAFGALVIWNDEAQTVTVSKEGTVIFCQVGSAEAYLNGKPVTIDTPPQLVEGRTMVPLRFISEGLGLGVSWDNPTSTIRINGFSE